MKRHLLKLAVVFGVLALAAQAQALAITPTDPTPFDYGALGEEPQGNDSYLGSDLLYKQDVGGSESGALAGSYETTFFNTPSDPSDALIDYVGGDVVGPTAYLLVKDGNQDPAWYIFNLTALNWTGVEDLDLSGFWPDGGSISHVSLYGSTDTPPDTPRLPEPGTLLLLGGGLVGLALYGRKTFKR